MPDLHATTRPTRVLQVHNAYQIRGGEDMVVEAERQLLESRGHEVVPYYRHNDEVQQMGKLSVAAGTFWSWRAAQDIDALIQRTRPDVLHVHNTFPLISPSILWRAHRAGLPVVMTLHNYRLLCPQAMLLREGKVCEDCVGRVPWRAVTRACYRQSVAQSTVLATTLAVHSTVGTFQRKVTRFIALTEFAKAKLVQGGFDEHKIIVKPNFVDIARHDNPGGKAFLFAGRLSKEKGIDTLARTAQQCPDVQFRIAGDGSYRAELSGLSNVTFLGALSQDSLRAEMCRARALIVPSIWYEGFPRVVVEAFACSLPVIASRIGSLSEIIANREDGLLFALGSDVELADAIRLVSQTSSMASTMGRNARAKYESLYSPDAAYRKLVEIYGAASSAMQ